MGLKFTDDQGAKIEIKRKPAGLRNIMYSAVTLIFNHGAFEVSVWSDGEFTVWSEEENRTVYQGNFGKLREA